MTDNYRGASPPETRNRGALPPEDPPAEREIERLATRLRRLEHQIRAFKELHATELQMILDELSDIAGELDTNYRGAVASRPGAPAPAPENPPGLGQRATDAAPAEDPAAISPKRAKWLADQERRNAPVSRRDLLRGRGEDPS